MTSPQPTAVASPPAGGSLGEYAALLDVDNFNLELFEHACAAFMAGNAQAQAALSRLEEHPNAWLKVDHILEHAREQQSKFIACRILERTIQYRWKSLPAAQCAGIRSFIVGMTVKLCAVADMAEYRRASLLLTKLDQVLVLIIKQDYPTRWPDVIEQLVQSSQSGEFLCLNNMVILGMLSAEIFDFSKGEMTEAKIKELKDSLENDFRMVFTLCEYCLREGAEKNFKQELLEQTLKTLLRYLSWIPLGYIFETSLIPLLLERYFPAVPFRSLALQCLTEIASLKIASTHDEKFAQLYLVLLGQLAQIIPPNADLATAFADGSDADQEFIYNLALFLVSFFKEHLAMMEKAYWSSPEQLRPLLDGHGYLAMISMIDDAELFKITLEYWHQLSQELYQAPFYAAQPLLLSSSATPSRRDLYARVLPQVRVAVIQRMAKPEEVLVVENETTGEVEREYVRDSEATVLYKTMRETLVYLTHLDYQNTTQLMLEKLDAQVKDREWSWQTLNTLCWAIGSISGALLEEDEKKFLVTVIKDLLQLCDNKRGKSNKAIIASNIMYIVGQYPRFLRAHWKFLKTVVNKLFEFMHELHPGVQDMACDTFLKIAQKCRRKFVLVQAGETAPFVEEILRNLQQTVGDLQPAQVQTFYEAVGHMIASQTNPTARAALVAEVMRLPNAEWGAVIAHAKANVEGLRDMDVIKRVDHILRINVRMATALGPAYLQQMGEIYLDALNVYKVYSKFIAAQIQAQGEVATKHAIVRYMCNVKKQTLQLIDVFVTKSDDVKLLRETFVAPLFEAVLVDYQQSIPQARGAEVLSLVTTIIHKLGTAMTEFVPGIFAAVFEVTLEMITKGFNDYLDHRVAFFTLIGAVNEHCFAAFFALPSATFKLVIDSIVWAFKHTMRHISEMGLEILHALWTKIEQGPADVAQSFYQTFFLSLLQDLLVVLTDTFHKSGFKLQTQMLARMVTAVNTQTIVVPLWPADAGKFENNQQFLAQFVFSLISKSFSNLTQQQVSAFVSGLFTLPADAAAFKTHIRDFLVQIKEFSGGDDNAELFAEEHEAAAAAQQAAKDERTHAVPGMRKQIDIIGEEMD